MNRTYWRRIAALAVGVLVVGIANPFTPGWEEGDRAVVRDVQAVMVADTVEMSWAELLEELRVRYQALEDTIAMLRDSIAALQPEEPPVDQPPRALWSHACVGLECCFLSRVSVDDDSIVSHEWLVSGEVVRTGDSISHTFGDSTALEVTLRVTDTAGQQDTSTRRISTEAEPDSRSCWATSLRFLKSGESDTISNFPTSDTAGG